MAETEQYQFKATDSKIKKYPLYLGNISKDFTANNINITGLSGYVYEFLLIIILLILVILSTFIKI